MQECFVNSIETHRLTPKPNIHILTDTGQSGVQLITFIEAAQHQTGNWFTWVATPL